MTCYRSADSATQKRVSQCQYVVGPSKRLAFSEPSYFTLKWALLISKCYSEQIGIFEIPVFLEEALNDNFVKGILLPVNKIMLYDFFPVPKLYAISEKLNMYEPEEQELDKMGELIVVEDEYMPWD